MYCIVTVVRFVIILVKFYVCMYGLVMIFGPVGQKSRSNILYIVCFPA